MRTLLSFLIVPAVLGAQSFTFGAKVGAATTATHSESRPYAVGPTVELQWPGGFAVEAGALYRRLGATQAYTYFPAPDTSALLFNRIRGNSWEFPVVGKYYFRRRSTVQPFLGTGWALRTINWQHQGQTTILSGQNLAQVYPFNTNVHSGVDTGVTIVGGFRVKVGRMQWQPEVRYTRWGQDSNSVQLPKNEGGVFLGFRF